MQSDAPLSLPSPWQRVMTNWPELELGSAFYDRLAGYLDLPHNPLDRRILSGRDVDLDTGIFTGYLRNGRIFKAKTQYLGSHDSSTHDGLGFLWADSDPALPSGLCDLARLTRKNLWTELPLLAEKNDPKIDRCSALALLSFAGVEADVDLTFHTTGSKAYFICLSDIVEIEKEDAPPHDNPFTISELLAPPESQLMRGQKPYRELAVLEPLLKAASSSYQDADYTKALGHIADIKTHITTSVYDQEPGGWIAICEGLSLLALGNKKDAESILQTAANSDNPPEITLNQIALARCTKDGSLNKFIGAWFAKADRFIELASDAEQEMVLQALTSAMSARCKEYDDPISVLKAATLERYTQEVTAAQNNAAARNMEVEQDSAIHAARIKRNATYQTMLMRWFTPGRAHWMNSFTLEPIENPELARDMSVESQSDEKATITVSYDGATLTHDYRYILEKRAFPLLVEPVWRIAEIWSLSDHGDIRIQ